MSGPAPAAPDAYKLKSNKSQLWALVADYTKELNWVWWPPSLPRFRFYLTIGGFSAHLVAEEYDFWMPVNREMFTVSVSELSRRGMLAPAHL